jgi:hypothetical protein
LACIFVKLVDTNNNTLTAPEKMRHPNNPAGIYFQGTCEENPVLPLKPVYYNNSDKALSKPPTMLDYRLAAPIIAKKYALECPGTEAISFSLNPIPEA